MASAEIAGSTECELRIDDSIACPGKGNGRDILELVRMAPRDALVVDTLSGLVSQAERVSGQRPIEICSCYSRCHRVIRSRSSVVLFGPTSPSALPEILWHKSIKDALCCLLDPSHTWIAFGSIKDVILASFENGNDLAIFQAHNGPVTMIYPLGASTRILSFGEDQTFAVWDVSTFELTYHSMPISRRAAVTCIATEVVDNSSECGPIIHRIAFGFENAFIQLWENRSEYGHADRWELAFDTSSTSRAAFAA